MSLDLPGDVPRLVRFVPPPFHAFLFVVFATCFTAALLTDLAYWATALIDWANFSAWLISAGTILAWLFAIVGVIELIARPVLRRRRGVGAYALGNLVVLGLATLNMLVHARDAWTSVVPWGLALSAATVVVLLVTAWFAATLICHVQPEVDRR